MILILPSKIFRSTAPVLALALLVASSPAKQSEVSARTQLPPANVSSQKAEGDAEPEAPETWRYLLHLPEDYKKSGQTWPLILYLHGRSIRGDDLKRLKRYGPPSFLERRPAFPFVVVSPQLPDGSWPAASLLELLDEIQETYRIDPDRTYLTGVSLGAGGAWYLAAEEPSRFAAFAPVCGYGHVGLAKKLTGLPIWGFHGSEDELTPLENHQRLIDAVNANGGNARLTVIPGGTHGSIIVPVYKQQELYDWFLANARGKPASQRPPGPDPALIARAIPKPETPKPPGKSEPEPEMIDYTVKSGDTLWQISRDHETSVSALTASNSLTSDTIYVGQVLRVPAP